MERKKNQEAERIARENQVPDTLINIRTGFQYKEDRSVDPSHPPKTIDFSKDIPVMEFKLGDLTSRISYLVLQVPDDSLYFLEWPEINITSKSIIVNNNMGIHRFDRDGKFIETICKNTFSVPRDIEPGHPASNFFSKETFIGAWRNHVQTVGNTVFYKYTNYPAETVSLLRFTSEDRTQNLQIPQIAETGTPRTYARGDTIATGKESLSSSTPGLSSTSILAVSDNCYAGITTRLKAFVDILK